MLQFLFAILAISDGSIVREEKTYSIYIKETLKPNRGFFSSLLEYDLGAPAKALVESTAAEHGICDHVTLSHHDSTAKPFTPSFFQGPTYYR